jgi:hypothetical protein
MDVTTNVAGGEFAIFGSVSNWPSGTTAFYLAYAGQTHGPASTFTASGDMSFTLPSGVNPLIVTMTAVNSTGGYLGTQVDAVIL